MTQTAAQFVAAARSFKGGWYRSWTGAYPEYGPPGYMDFNPDLYTPEFYFSEGGHCSGYVNLVCQAVGLEPGGLTGWWADHAWKNGGEPFDVDRAGRPGAIAVKGWTPGSAPGVAEGHIVIYTGEYEIIHCTPGRGVVEGDTDYGTFPWAQYEVYFEPPWLDFCDSSEISVQSSPWIAPDHNGHLVLNGSGWARHGWFWVPESWHPPTT